MNETFDFAFMRLSNYFTRFFVEDSINESDFLFSNNEFAFRDGKFSQATMRDYNWIKSRNQVHGQLKHNERSLITMQLIHRCAKVIR